MKSHYRLSAMCRALAALAMAAPAMASYAADDAAASAPAEPASAAPDSSMQLELQDLPAAPKPRKPVVPAVPVPDDADKGGKQRIIYLPESERQRLRNELREEILNTARDENWAQPNSIPDWVQHIHPAGDLMFRGEGDFYDKNNNNQFLDFRSINSGAPLNTTPPPAGQPVPVPTLNTTENRKLLRLRARFGFTADVADSVKSELRLATGNTTNPVSTNQTLGGDFNKLNVVVDRADIRYQLAPWAATTVGRMPNPLTTATDLVWDRDLSFDGIGLNVAKDFGKRFGIKADTGFFAVENTDPNYPQNSIIKLPSHDKWLAALRVQALWRPRSAITLAPSLAYYDFINVQGQLSSPCFAPSTSVACDTDGTRPQFEQKGNTVFAIRQITVQNAGDPVFEYYGLASAFRIGHAALSADARVDGPVHVAADAEFAHNFAYSARKIRAQIPVNNLGPCAASEGSCTQAFVGGGNAYQLQLRVGYPVVEERGQWQGTAGYRRVESDAVLDAFTDSDFHLGGTNARGYYVGAQVGVAHHTYVQLRYFSATEVSGPPLSIDVLQIDTGVRF